MNSTIKYMACLSFMALSGTLMGQAHDQSLTLNEALRLAREQSLDALVAKNELKASYWQLRSYKADLLPSLAFEGTLPSINKSVQSYQNGDGTYTYVHSNASTVDLNLIVDQNIPLTGGHLSVSSQLQRIDQLGANSSTQHMSCPVGFTYEQPLFSFNKLKWQGRIEPIKYEEAKRRYCANMEQVQVKTITLYFDLLLAKVNSDIAEQNLKNATRLYEIASAKKGIGVISDNDLLQLRLSKINFDLKMAEVRLEFEKRMFALRSYLGFNDKVSLLPEVPTSVPSVATSFVEVMQLARNNNPFLQEVQRRILTTQMQVAEAKAARGFKTDLFFSFGLTGSNNTFAGAYHNLNDLQVAKVGVRIPILDWGKGRSRVEQAKSQLEVEKGKVEQETQRFEENIFISVKQLMDQPRQLSLAQEADSVAQQRYKTSFETFIMGKINILDINDAQVSRDEAKRNYISQLYGSWLFYYNIRQITLFDFEKRGNLTIDEKLLLL
jgi:outer membrane protein TolC